MSDTLDALVEQAEAEKKTNRPGTFDTETARVAAMKSSAVRRPIDKEKDARKAYSYILQTADLIATRLLSAYEPCKHCKRGGPTDIKLLDSLSRTLQNLSETILEYAWGRPAQESRAGRESSVEEYKKALRQVRSEDNKAFIPEDLPTEPDEPSERSEDNE